VKDLWNPNASSFQPLYILMNQFQLTVPDRASLTKMIHNIDTSYGHILRWPPASLQFGDWIGAFDSP
jgi:hypothetical protein